MPDHKCPYCRHRSSSTCPGCDGTGTFNEEQYQRYRFETLIRTIATTKVGQGPFARKDNTARLYEKHRQVNILLREFDSLSPETIGDLTDRLVPDEGNPEKTWIFKNYTRADFPGLEDSSAQAVLSML